MHVEMAATAPGMLTCNSAVAPLLLVFGKMTLNNMHSSHVANNPSETVMLHLYLEPSCICIDALGEYLLDLNQAAFLHRDE